MQDIFSVVGALVGIAAAVLWWLSAQSFFSMSKTKGDDLPSGGDDGDTFYGFNDGTGVVMHNSRVALTNAWAALLSGVAILLQVAPTLLRTIDVNL